MQSSEAAGAACSDAGVTFFFPFFFQFLVTLIQFRAESLPHLVAVVAVA